MKGNVDWDRRFIYYIELAIHFPTAANVSERLGIFISRFTSNFVGQHTK